MNSAGALLKSNAGSLSSDACGCPVGKYNSATTVCTDCAAGTYRDTLGATKASDCIPCPRG